MINTIDLCIIVALALAIIFVSLFFVCRIKRNKYFGHEIHVSGGADIEQGFIKNDNNYFKGFSSESGETMLIGKNSNSTPDYHLNVIINNLSNNTSSSFVLFDDIIIGRTLGENVLSLIDDNAVSKKHCRLFLSDSQVFIEDLDSVNHTRVNGKIIDYPIILYPKDIVQVGKTTLCVVY